jgi:Domain of unknown function (DUF4333)
MNRFLRTLPICFAILSLASCKQKIDPSKVQDLCKSLLKDDTDIEAKTIVCPKDIEVKKGNDFECVATTDDGDEVTLTVDQTDDKGTVLAKVKSGTMDMAKVGDSIEKKIGEKADVKCKSRFLVPKVDKTYKCDVDIDGKPHKVDITFTDKKGSVSWKLED